MEKFVRLIVTNRLFALLFTFVILLIGWINLPAMKISQDPSVELPLLVITAELPGASADEIEQRVVNKIEEELEDTNELKKFDTIIRNSVAVIRMEYHYGVDIDDEYVDINAKLNSIQSELPEAAEINLEQQNLTDLLQSFVLAMVSDVSSDTERRVAAEDVKARLREVQGIEGVKVMSIDEEIRIDLDTARLSRYGIDVRQIFQAIQGNNRFLPTGQFSIGEKSITVLPFSGGYRDIDALRATMLISANNSALALHDVASVYKTRVPDSRITRVNGRPATLISMRLSENANVFSVKRKLSEVTDLLDKELAASEMELVYLFDSETGVRYKMKELFTNIVQGMVLLSIVLLFAVGYRSALVISVMLPLALILSVVGLSMTDYGLQQISLAGFIISLGLIVDNGIVVTENTYKLQAFKKLDRREASIIGTSEVLAPLLSSTVTTALAFAPLFFLTSATGLYLRSMSVTIWFCLAASLMVAVIFSSLMLYRLGTENRLGRLPPAPSFMFALIPVRDNIYRRVTAWFIAKPWALLIVVVMLLSLTLFLASRLQVIVFPDSEEPYFTINIESPADRNQAYVDALAAEIEAAVLEHPRIERCTTIVGEPFPFIDVGIAVLKARRHNAQLFCQVDFRNSTEMGALVDRLNEQFSNISEKARVDVSSFIIGGDKGDADIELKLTGPDIKQVRHYAREIDKALRSADIEGFRNLNNAASSTWYAINIRFKERLANAMGVSRAQVDQILVLLTHGAEIDEFRTKNGDKYPIVLRAEYEFEEPLAVFDRMFVTATNGARIPLSQVLEVQFGENEYDIEHRMFRPMADIAINVDPGADLRTVTMAVRDVTDSITLPEGFRLEILGELASTQEEFGGAGKYVLIVALVILGIFILQFSSILQPLIVAAAIPLSFIGAFILLFLTNQPMSFLAFVGLTSLMGIVVNNSILLVDEANRLRLKHPQLAVGEVAVRAGCSRFMPIVLTSITSIFGLLPLALGNSMFKPLAIVVIGGLATSTVLTLICIPVLYSLLTRGPVAKPDAEQTEAEQTEAEQTDAEQTGNA